MIIISAKFNKSLLMSGEDFKLTNNITLRQPTISEITALGNNCDDIYWRYVYSILTDPYSNMVMLDDMGINFMDTTPFEVFVIKWKQAKQAYLDNQEKFDSVGFNPCNLILSALGFFIVEKHNFELSYYQDTNEPCFYDVDNKQCQINKEIFEYIYEWVKAIHKINSNSQINPADENARLVLIEDMRDELKKAKKRNKKNKDSNDTIGNLMGAISFGGNGSISPFDLPRCKIYWLFEGYGIDSNKTNANHMISGIYHGTVSSKDVNKDSLDWVNK